MCSSSTKMTQETVGNNQLQANKGGTEGDVTLQITGSFEYFACPKNMFFADRIVCRITGCPLQTWINK